MTTKKKILNRYHVVFLAQNIIIGIDLFLLPNKLSPAGYDLWLLPVLYGIIATISLIPMISLCKRYPEQTLFEISEEVLGKTLGKLLNIILLSYALLQGMRISESYLQLVQLITLPEFSIILTGSTLIFVVTTIVIGGISSVARFCMLAFFFTIWMLYFLGWAFNEGTWIRLIPRIDGTIHEWIQAAHNGSPSITGYFLIMFYFPYIIDKKNAFKDTAIGIWISVSVYLLVCIASIVYFSKWQLENLLYPVLNLFQAVELSNVERIEILGVSMWIFLILSTVSAYLWVSKKGLDGLFNNHKHKDRYLYILVFLLLFLILGPLPQDLKKLVFEEGLTFASYGFLFLPLFILVISRLRFGKGSEQK